jgi:hypothetical protein
MALRALKKLAKFCHSRCFGPCYVHSMSETASNDHPSNNDLNSNPSNAALAEALATALTGGHDDWYNGLTTASSALTAEQATALPAAGRSAIAGHLQHCSDTLRVASGWLAGQQPPIDWPAAWQLAQPFDEASWQAVQAEFASFSMAWQAQVAAKTDWDAKSLALAINVTAHLAYHAGAVMQIRKLVVS